jgi:LacI family transcriptional regulator
MTIKDVAVRAGVSFTTVSHVINNTRNVSPDVRARVEQAIAELGYRPNRVARSLRKQETLTVGVINSVNNDPYFAEVLSGIESACFASGYNVILCHTEPGACYEIPDPDKPCHAETSLKKELDNIEMLQEKGVDGIITHSLMNEDKLGSLLGADMPPVLFLHQYLEGLGMDTLCTDDYSGGRLAAEYLLTLGHRHIGCLAGYAGATHTVRFREQGWRDALKDSGITPLEGWHVETGYDPQSGYKALSRLLGTREPPTALVCYCDTQAIGVIRAAKDLGIGIPGDLSLVSFDNLIISQYTVPRLTTVEHPKFGLGQEAVSRLVARIADPSLPAEKRLMPVTLINGETTAPPPH